MSNEPTKEIQSECGHKSSPVCGRCFTDKVERIAGLEEELASGQQGRRGWERAREAESEAAALRGQVAAISAKAKESSDYMTRKLNEGDSSMRAIEIGEAQYPLMEIATNTAEITKEHDERMSAAGRIDGLQRAANYAGSHPERMGAQLGKEIFEIAAEEAKKLCSKGQ